MKKILLLSALLSCYGISVSGQDQPFTIMHGPWLCDMSETGVTIMWLTNRNALSWVEIAPDDGSHFYGKERPKYYDTRMGRKQASTNLHKVRVENLSPGKKYRYAVFSREVLQWQNDSEIIFGTTIANESYSRNSLSFQTFSAEDDTVSFVMFNDIHGQAQFMKDISRDIDFSSIDLVVFNGDMSSAIYNEEQIFSDFMDAAVELFAKRIPIAMVRGNHETRGPYADFLLNYFPVSGGKPYRIFNNGDVAFVLLECGEDKPDSDIEYSSLADFDAWRNEQEEWLKEAVKSRAFRHASNKVVFLHMPPGAGNWHGNLHLDETLLPVLNESGIDVVLSGHTHRYSFNPPLAGKTAFPVIVNSNNACIRGDIINGKIRIRIHGPEGTEIVEHLVD